MKHLILAGCLAIYLGGCNLEDELPSPNILWITCEDISPQLGSYGDAFAHTPHLDKLAQEGVLYTHAYASAPVCAVARSSIITGMYASSYGSQHMRCTGRLPQGIQTYPEYLRAAGYYCTNNSKTDYNLNIDNKAIWDESSTQAHWRKRPDPDQAFFAIFNYTTTHESRVNDPTQHQKAIANVPNSLLKKAGEDAQQAGTMPQAGQHIIAPQKPVEELFDAQKDPFELQNLAEDPAYATILADMQQAHAQWSDRTKDTGLIPETILRRWEKQGKASIYDIMKNQSVPVSLIRETALGQKDIEELLSALGHKNEAVRYWAGIHLGNRARELSDGSLLEKTLQDPVPVVQSAAARALIKMAKPEKALTVLEQLLQHEDEWVRLNAAQVLDEAGPQAQAAIEALQGVMKDDNKYVVRVANHALNAMLGLENVVR